MESKVEAIKEAIKQLMREEDEEEEDHNLNLHLLSKLMSQLEKLEGESTSPAAAAAAAAALSKSKSIGNESTLKQEDDDDDEKIVKELKKVSRQNVITHCLLSAMIVLTVAWQISEVSIILKLKHGLTHPFRSVATMLKRIILKPKPKPIDDTSPSITSDLIDQSTSMVHDLKLPHLQL